MDPQAVTGRGEQATTLPAAFREVATSFPGNVAIVGDHVLTYAELDERSDHIAAALAGRGVSRGEFVGVVIDRSEQTPAALLGVLKAGGAYVPLDPAYPARRLRQVVADTGVRVLVGDARQAAACGLSADDMISPVPAAPRAVRRARAAGQAGESDPAYVIHTSGSTGMPKGCIVTHGNVLALMRSTLPLFDVGPADRWSLFHSFGFDFSVWELWGALLTGGAAVCVPEQYVRSPEDLIDLLARHRVTVFSQVPSVFRAFARSHQDAGSPALPLRYVIFGGESVDLASAADFARRAGGGAPVMVNMYGITEATVHSTLKVLGEADYQGSVRSPIGVPLPHVTISLRAQDLRQVADGETGEIWIGGPAVAAGYHNRPELTAQRFVAVDTPEGPRVMYRTGDFARRLAGGELEYLGRGDLQVKLRGFRIELGEIEAMLRGHDLVRDVAVTMVDRHSSGQMLVACVVVTREISPGDLSAELRRYAARMLPRHMVPAQYRIMPELPVTFSGKLDRRAVGECAAQVRRTPR